MSDTILDIRDLSIALHGEGPPLSAVDGVNFSVGRGEVFGLVGESGCGKSLCALAIAGLLQAPMAVSGGQILLEGRDLARLSAAEMRHLRGDKVSMIFQEPMTALNPLMTVGDQIGEMFVLHRGLGARAARMKAIEALEQVQVSSPERRINAYPHQLSGGMRQRVMIAIALACDPALLIADEPTTALDVTIQAEIVELVLELCRAKGTAVMMISHDLGLVARICNRVAVMYAGQIVEERGSTEIFTAPAHPYTRGLVDALPRLGRRLERGQEKLTEIGGVVPAIRDFPQGCRFAPRCPRVTAECRAARIPMTALTEEGRVRCLHHV
ncbi:ABC transporter ATP-binding protein [Gemmobacter fulvus]|uniref:ABC transporter ATP-binding protein n=1 Tax=Gemmobacter fulvus TaxID=2840474 RepID=A0A975P3P4_9RHOB|nr:ABC transporter ATP-binding protein [Gemmobacter fulvus]MBT9245896.1 ABC transporter ATP-binding protein [Gemmobacter fulvus]QWK89275.1 ABC transporter ATP-binding protein [Gemmobacter fulvus]